jgi:hypothetical protein
LELPTLSQTAPECQSNTDNGNCRESDTIARADEFMYDEVWNANPTNSAVATPVRSETYNEYSSTELDVPPLSGAYSYYGETASNEVVTDPSAREDNPDTATDDALRSLGQLDQADTLERGMVLYDIARKALVDRSAITGEQTDHDSIMRECNRIMVLNGYPDANLEGKSNIKMGDLPRAWNGVRWDQEFKLYDEAALSKFAGMAADSQPSADGDSEPQEQRDSGVHPQDEPAAEPEGNPEAEPETPAAPEPPAAPEVPETTPPGDLGDRSSVDSANEFYICQFKDQRWNPQGPSSSNDCGPTALAMIAKYYDLEFEDEKYGHIDAGDGNPAHLVSAVRYLMTGGRDEQGLTGLSQIKDAASDLRLNTSHVESMKDLDDALDAGRMVVLAGNPKEYQEELGLHYGRGGTVYDGGHFITIVGRQGDNYIVNDPANHGGSMLLTRDQVEKYTSYVRPENRGAAIWADRPHDEQDIP